MNGTFITGLVRDADGTPYFTVAADIPVSGRKIYERWKEHHLSHPEGWDKYQEIVVDLLADRDSVGSGEIISELRKRSRELTDDHGDECFRVNNNHRSSYARLFLLTHPDDADRVGVRSCYLDRDRKKPVGHVRAGEATAETREALDEEEEEVRRNLQGVSDVEVAKAEVWKVLEALRAPDVKAARSAALKAFAELGG